MSGKTHYSFETSIPPERIASCYLESCSCQCFVILFVSSVVLPESAAEAVEAREWLARLGVLVLLALLVALVVDSATEMVSSTQDVISHTEWRLIPAFPPVEESMSYSTTGVSMGTL